MTTDLFAPVSLGPLTLSNRIVMAPLTRSRAQAGGVQGALNATYYAQRASAGLIISEATNISRQGRGYALTPGIFTAAQVAGWRLVTDAVHAAGGRIFCQLWHVGRISHPDLQADGALPVAPSAIRPKGMAFTDTGFQPFVTPRALRTDEMPGIVADYAHAARCAQQAGFDGVEIHAANGYLIDQFLRTGTNRREDYVWRLAGRPHPAAGRGDAGGAERVAARQRGRALRAHQRCQRHLGRRSAGHLRLRRAPDGPGRARLYPRDRG